MRASWGALLLASVGFATPAWADDDDWFETEEPADAAAPDEVEEAEPAEESAPPPRAKKKKRPRPEPQAETSDVPLDRKGRPKRVIPAVEGEDPPPGYVEKSRARKALWIPGVSMLGAGYLISAATSAVMLTGEDAFCVWECYRDDRAWEWGFLPVAGPFVIAASDSFETEWRALYGTLGVVQAAGMVLTIVGVTSREQVWVRGRAPRAPRALEPEVKVGAGFASVSVPFH